MVEAIINSWTIHHFFFGLGISLIISYLATKRHGVFTISFFILVLWEMFELKEKPSYWLINYQNNIMDVIIGVIAVVIGRRFFELIIERYKISVRKR